MSSRVVQLRPDIDPLASLDPVLLQVLTAHAHEVVSIVDRQGRVLFSGGAIERVFGFAPDERLGREALDLVHPEDLDYARSRLRGMFTDAASPDDPVAVRLRHRSGEYLHCEITGTRLQHAGSTALLVLHTRDVTAQARAIARSAAAEVRLEVAVRGADIGLWEYDVNAGRMTRTEDWFERHDLPAMAAVRPAHDWLSQVHPDDAGHVQRAVDERLAGRAPPGQIEYRIRSRSGRWTWIVEYANVIARNPDGTTRVLAGVCCCGDETKALESELVLASERLQLAVDASGMALWDWRVAEDAIYCSSNWSRLFREPTRRDGFWSRCLMPGLDGIHPEDRALVEAAYRAHASGAVESFTYETRRRCGDGSWRWMRSSGRAVERDPDGLPLRILGCTTDVHERRLAEERLAASELRFRTASSLAREHLAEFGLDAEGKERLLWCSDGLPAMLACDPAEFAALCGEGRFVHPDDREAYLEMRREVHAGRVREFDTRLVGLDGRVLTCRLVVQPIAFDPAGRVTRLLSTIVEVGAAGGEPGASGLARLQQTLLEYIPACVVLLGADRRIRFANPMLQGLFPEAAVGGELEDCFHPQWRTVVASAITRCRDENRNVEVEGIAPAAASLAGRSFRMHIAPVETRGVFGGWCVVVRDVTHTRDAESHAFTAIGRDPQRIGHELHDGVGQQLTGATLLMQTLATELGAEKHRLAGDVERIAGLVNQSIDDVRMLARSLSPVGSAPTGLPTAMHSLAARARSLGKLSVDLHLMFETGSTLTAVEADHLYWIAQEAVTNAIRHAGARRLEIGLEVTGEAFSLRVRDDGQGVEALESAQRDPRPGLGLRLMAHRARGLGANFTVTPHSGGGTLVTCVRARRG